MENKKVVKTKEDEKTEVKRMRRKKKGFTLIELLAVIVILGLLMAIAIPSVTKYITESRKKTLTTTVNNYIGALVNEVNDLEYIFTGQNTIYAVPIECISLERGGTSPFGEWMQANDNYWAYVLIQYDDTNSKYVYGFTFKDSAGYGLYPTIQSKIKEKGSQIKTGLDLNRPVSGDITSLTTLTKWQQSGFDVDSTTDFRVLEATSEGELGDGETTCTLCQKGKNYAQIEEEKIKKAEEEKANAPAYAIFSEDDGSLTFIRSIEEPVVGGKYNGKTITNVFTGFELDIYYPVSDYDQPFAPWNDTMSGGGKLVKSIVKVIFDDVISPISTAGWFADLTNCSYIDLTNLNTSKTTKMNHMFFYAGANVNHFEVVGLDDLDFSSVTTMYRMFNYTANGAASWELGNFKNWDVSSVTDMGGMFAYTASNTTTDFILNLEGWDVRSVTNMNYMFDHAGYKSNKLNITFKNFNSSNLQKLAYMFYQTGYNSTEWKVAFNGFDTQNLTNMSNMFQQSGYKSNIFVIEGLDNFDTHNVTSMGYVFSNSGYSASSWSVGDLSNWDTQNVTYMGWMFSNAGYSASTFVLSGLASWNTQKVTTMSNMFSYCGYKAPYYLDLSSWDVAKVSSSSKKTFNTGVTSKVKSPF